MDQCGFAAAVGGLIVALMFGRDSQGWRWIVGDELQALLHWRWPRVLAALAAGMMLAVAGTLIQKLTGNPMASPEVLGISSGAAFGVVIMLFIVPGNALNGCCLREPRLPSRYC